MFLMEFNFLVYKLEHASCNSHEMVFSDKEPRITCSTRSDIMDDDVRQMGALPHPFPPVHNNRHNITNHRQRVPLHEAAGNSDRLSDTAVKTQDQAFRANVMLSSRLYTT